MNERFDPNAVADYERDTWSRCAEDYVDTFAGITGETVPLLSDAAGIQAGSNVLEIGSGPGHVADMLAQAGATVTGVDFSANMVNVANGRYPRIIFAQADAEDLPFDDATFDAVVANFVVHHLARPEKVFREVNRVLKPGGRFAFAVWGVPEEQSSIGAFFGAVAAHHDLEELPHGPLFGVTEQNVYEPMLAQADLQECQLSTHEMTWAVDSLEPVLKGFWVWGDLAALPEETQSRIEATTRENSESYKQDGGYAFPHAILIGSAKKT